jgi:hypothetical protein
MQNSCQTWPLFHQLGIQLAFAQFRLDLATKQTNTMHGWHICNKPDILDVLQMEHVAAENEKVGAMLKYFT